MCRGEAWMEPAAPVTFGGACRRQVRGHHQGRNLGSAHLIVSCPKSPRKVKPQHTGRLGDRGYMSYLSLYRQWRPQSFEDIVGQDHIVRTLRNAIANNRVVHAYMFTGPRGTGKTSTAKVFAKALNCVNGPTVSPCGECVSCVAVKEGNALDVIEIDAASNRGIDEIRDLRDKVRFAPSQGRYKVYIIDEVHMLTMEAFNALLKTLEEPPSHAIFILATTEANRVPATILSRCQRFDFNRLNLIQLTEHLMKVAGQLKLEYEKDALQLLARKAEGSARDALGLLEQVSGTAERITSDMISDMLGATAFERLAGMACAIAGRDAAALLPMAADALMSGTDPRQLLGELGEHFMDILLAKDCPQRKDLLHSGEERFQDLAVEAEQFDAARLRRIVSAIGQGMAEVGKAPNPRLAMELFLARLIESDGASRPDAARPSARSQAPSDAVKHAAASASRTVVRLNEATGEEPHKTSDVPTSGHKPDDDNSPGTAPEFWGRLLEQVRGRSVKVEALIRQARPYFDGHVLTIEYSPNWSFHHQKMQEEPNASLMKEALSAVTGKQLGYRCVLTSVDGEGMRQEQQTDIKGVTDAEGESGASTVSALQSQTSKRAAASRPKTQKKIEESEIKDEGLKESIEAAKALFGEIDISVEED